MTDAVRALGQMISCCMTATVTTEIRALAWSQDRFWWAHTNISTPGEADRVRHLVDRPREVSQRPRPQRYRLWSRRRAAVHYRRVRRAGCASTHSHRSARSLIHRRTHFPARSDGGGRRSLPSTLLFDSVTIATGNRWTGRAAAGSSRDCCRWPSASLRRLLKKPHRERATLTVNSHTDPGWPRPDHAW